MDRPVSDAEKLEALGRGLAAEIRRPTERGAQLLRYIVSEDVEGRAHQIKAVTIAQDVFGKGAEFDPSNDSSVRVEAKRLRDFLAEYYAAEGAADPVRIDIPKGAYAPCYIPQAAAPPQAGRGAAAPAAPHPQKDSRHALRSALLVAATAVIVLAAVAILAPATGVDLRTRLGFGPAGVVVHVDSAGAPVETAAIATDVMVRSPDLEIVSRVIWPWRPHYLLRLTQASADAVLTATLRHEPDDTMLASRQFRPEEIGLDAPTGTLSEFQIWLGALAARNGQIVSDYFSRGEMTAEMRCIQLMETYFVEQSDANHLTARTCFEDELSAGHRSATIYTGLAMLTREEYTDGHNPLPGDALDRALLLASKAVKAEPLNAHAQYALMTVLFAAGNVTDAVRVGQEAVRLDPFDGEIVGGFAARLNVTGRHAEALELLLRSERLRPGTAPWRNHGYFLAYLGLDEPERAAEAAMALRGRTNPLYLAALAIAYDIKKDPSASLAAYRALIALEPDPVSMYLRRHYAPDLVARLSQGLERVARRARRAEGSGLFPDEETR